MTKADLVEAQALLYAALAEPIGLLISTNDPERARQRLYRARKELNDPALQELQFRVSPFEDGDLVICKPRGSRGSREEAQAILDTLA